MARDGYEIAVAGAGGGGKGGSSGGVSEQPNTLRSRAYAQIVDLISEGEIGGLVNGAQSIYLDEVPLQNPDGSYNFQNFQVAMRYGTQGQSYVPGFADVENEIAVGVKVLNGVPVVRTVNQSNIDAVRVTLNVPSLSQTSDKGEIGGTSVEYAIDLQSNGGGYVTQIDAPLSGKSTSKYEFAFRIELAGLSPPYDIRVRRVSADNTSSLVQNDLYFGTYATIVDAKLRRPNSAFAALSIDSAQFQSIPTRGYNCYGVKVQVPSNYEPVARTYSGLWDGTFKPAWTNNPAWLFYDLLTESRYGLGLFITPDQVDKWGLYTIAQYCDVMVDNGRGGTEPRFTCTAYLQTQDEAFTLLQQLASCFRGIRYWSAGTIGFAQDSPTDPVALFTPANVISGTFSYAGASGRAIHTVALVEWNDPNDFFRKKVEYVEDADGIARYGIIETKIAAFGCTSQAQAHRAGRWLLYTERLESELVTFRSGFEGAYAKPGEVIRIADPVKSSLARFGGRLQSATSSSVTLDAPVPLTAGHTYQFYAAVPDIGLVNGAVSASTTGPAQTLQVSLSSLPPVLSAWILVDDAATEWLWRVIKVTEPEKGQCEFTGIRHRPEKYGLVESNLPLDAILSTSIYDAPPTPANPKITTAVYQVGSTNVPQVLLSCDSVKMANSYEWTYRIDSDNAVAVTTPGPVLDLRNAKPGTYVATVRAVSLAQRRSTPATFTQLVTGLPSAPDALQSLALAAMGSQAVLSWTPITAQPVVSGGYVEIRFTTATPLSWSGATYVDRASGAATSITLPLMAGTYLARTLDVNGQYSAYIDAVSYNAGSSSGSLAASVSPTYLSSNAATTTTATVSASGGTKPYTYAWTRSSGDSSVSINSPSAASTTFSATVAAGSEKDATFICTVTDSAGAHVATSAVSVAISKQPIGGGGGGGGGGGVLP